MCRCSRFLELGLTSAGLSAEVGASANSSPPTLSARRGKIMRASEAEFDLLLLSFAGPLRSVFWLIHLQRSYINWCILLNASTHAILVQHCPAVAPCTTGT